MTDPTPATPVANADLVNSLQTVIEDITKNRTQVVQHRVDLQMQLDQNDDTVKRFDVLLHSLKLMASDPFAIQQVADRLAADEAAKNVGVVDSVNTEANTNPLVTAVGTGADPEGSAEVSAAPAAADSAEGTDANGSPVAGDSVASA